MTDGHSKRTKKEKKRKEEKSLTIDIQFTQLHFILYISLFAACEQVIHITDSEIIQTNKGMYTIYI